MKPAALFFLALLLAPLALAADVSQIREQAIIESIQAENQKTRQNITAFGEETHAMYLQEKANALREINNVVTKLKFTFALTVFFSVLAALEVHNFLKRRREQRYKKPTSEAAEKIQETLDKQLPPPPKPPEHLRRTYNPERWDQ